MLIEPHDETFAFTMRMLNFLWTLRAIKVQPNVYMVDRYARTTYARNLYRRS